MKELQKKYDQLQEKYGSKDLNAVYGYGCETNPKIVLVFMNPTKRNIATDKSWEGLRAQWLGTKQVWDFLTKCDLFSQELNNQIQSKKPQEWTDKFCREVYNEVEQNNMWITNLAKCTQDDARPLSDEIFKEYKELLEKEIEILNPQKILFFGNQVASIMLNEKITVSTTRKKEFKLKINNKEYSSFAIYYPVGNGRFNQHFAIEDIKNIIKEK